MQCTLFCTQGACILIRTKKKQRRKILLSCTAFHHLLCMKFVHKHDDMVSMLNRWEVKSKHHPINTSHQNTWRNVWFWFQNIWTTSEVASVQVLLQGYCRDRWPQNHLQEWSGMGIQIIQWIIGCVFPVCWLRTEFYRILQKIFLCMNIKQTPKSLDFSGFVVFSFVSSLDRKITFRELFPL